MRKILVIVGPTASGKSALAIKLASAIGGPASGWKGAEIVSADSRQVYRGLDIGSGKVTRREMQGVPHHMLDVFNPKKVFSVAQYQKLAYKKINDILGRGKLPIIVGGTGQYIDAITKGTVFPEVKPRGDLRRKLSKLTNVQLYKQLLKLDPNRAANIDKHNPRRLIRAIEIAKSIGRVPIIPDRVINVNAVTLGINPGKEVLRKKIHERLVRRMQLGLVAEIRNLHKSGISWKRLNDLGLEYRYVSLYLRDKLTKKEMLEKLESEIINYSKRQMTWFKRDKNIHWLNPNLFSVLRIRSLLHLGARGAL